MSSQERKESLIKLIKEYQSFKEAGRLDLTSEETIRTWLNQLLAIFNWDVRDTSQVLQEKVLSKAEKEKIKEINSQNTRPDYTLKIAAQKATFLDAKDISVRIFDDKEAAFQIKSYGYSILAPCTFISNFEEFAIYDCTYIPDQNQEANLGRLYFTLNDLVDNFEILEDHLLRENIYKGKLNELYAATMQDNAHVQKIPVDLKFAAQLSAFRLTLATNILNNNKGYIENNANNLSYTTQIIINRILFIRVCEARKIEENGLLLSFKRNGFWSTFKSSSYLEFYEHYDGPLFERIDAIHSLVITDNIFDELLNHLYYPSPYRFDVIPTKLLSNIYEIFLSKKLKIEGGLVHDEIKSEYLKTNGAVSTPQYLVQEVIKRTIPKEQLVAKGIEHFLSIKILDIACGSGIFAIEVFEYIEDIFRELYKSDPHPDFAKYFLNTNSDVIVNLSGKKAILDNCIFGVDIDLEAVEVTKMALSLKIVDNIEHLMSYTEMGIFGSKILNGVGNNIRCGNSLVESDVLEIFPKLLDNEEQLLATNSFDWDSNEGFKEVFDNNGGFDYIIGNPPYVEVKNYNMDLPYMAVYIKNKYPSAKNGKVDLAIPFIEKSVELLNESGRVGFIIQKRFFKTDYGKKIREIISDSKHLSSIIDFEATNIFKDRMTYVALLILDKAAQDTFTYRSFQEGPELLQSVLRETVIPEIDTTDYTTLPYTAIDANPWNFSDNHLIDIKSRLSQKGTLGDYASVKVGVQVLWDRAYHIRPISVEGDIIKGKSHLETNIEIEIGACRPLCCNEQFFPFKTDLIDVYVIFPYDVVNGEVSEISFSDFEQRFPLAGRYLKRNREKIESTVETMPEKNPQNYDADYWHIYTRANNHSAVYPKILIPMTSLDTFASVTLSDRLYCDNANMFFIKTPIKDDVHLYALSAIINSIIFSVLARSIANPQSGGYFKFNKQFLEPVPFPVENFSTNENLKEKLAAEAKKIEVLQKKYINASPGQKRVYKNVLLTIWQIIDKLCYEFYDLTSDEITFFDTKGRNIDRIDILD